MSKTVQNSLLTLVVCLIVAYGFAFMATDGQPVSYFLTERESPEDLKETFDLPDPVFVALTKNWLTGEKDIEDLRRVFFSYTLLLTKIDMATGNSPQAKQAKRQAIIALQKGQFEQAEKNLEEAAQIDLNKGQDYWLAASETYGLMAGVVLLFGDYEQAAQYYEQAAQTIVTIAPDQAGVYLVNQAKQLDEANLLSQTIMVHEKAVSLFEKELEADHPYMLMTLNNMANYYRRAKMYDQAEELFLRVIKYGEAKLSPEHSNLGVWYNNIAMTYSGNNKPKKAEEFFRKSLILFENILGKESAYTKSTANNFMRFLFQYDRSAEAEEIRRTYMEHQ
ncbi:MAG: tetratricopeptide repeat protein [Methylocystaceae bacterium]|nr:tetratricopeptide repeat protein [Methylocystaceae bacterium]